MSYNYNIHSLTDWSQIQDTTFLAGLDFSRLENNFGIHVYKNTYWTAGYVGVGRLYSHNNTPLQHNGKEEIVLITSQYGMNPWKMLEKVITDDEYELYVTEFENSGKFLYKIFYDQPMIKMPPGLDVDGDLLYALNFINSCYRLCYKGLKKRMILSEENYVSKIKGRIKINKNLRINTFHGRNDRFYCSYIDFSIDNIENRIIKSTLLKCKKIIEQRFIFGVESIRRAVFCLNALKNVKEVPIQISDFNRTSSSGLYIYYKPVLQQAHYIFKQKYYSFNNDITTISKGMYTIPYMINMETLFEFYARVIIKHVIDSSRYFIDSYSRKWFLKKNTSSINEAEKDIHLFSYCIPDIVICNKSNNAALFVLDAKYKSNNKTYDPSARNDSHQLLSYVLLTGVSKCGFIFPGSITNIKQMNNNQSNFLQINSNVLPDLQYCEIILGNNPQRDELESVFQ